MKNKIATFGIFIFSHSETPISFAFPSDRGCCCYLYRKGRNVWVCQIQTRTFWRSGVEKNITLKKWIVLKKTQTFIWTTGTKANYYKRYLADTNHRSHLKWERCRKQPQIPPPNNHYFSVRFRFRISFKCLWLWYICVAFKGMTYVKSTYI